MVKQKRDATLTKAKILEKAKYLFSKNGYDATTTDEIAKESAVNKAMIYYYFKNKSGLYASVMSGLFDAIYDEIVAAQQTKKSIEEELETFIKTYAIYAEENPYLPALLLRELSDSGAHLPELMFSSMRRLFTLLSDILQRGEEKGIFTQSTPMVIHFMIIGTLNLMITTEPLRKRAMQMNENVDTCSNCTIDTIAIYIFQSIRKILEVK